MRIRSITGLLLLFVLTACLSTEADDVPLIKIDSVSIGKMDGDNDPSEFSTKITLTNNNQELSNWQIGFYMARTFATLVSKQQSINPRIDMQICNANKAADCTPLVLKQSDSIKKKDQSIGNTSILAPQGMFKLSANTQYIVMLKHSNQWSSGNVSAFPQNFFIIFNGQVSNIPTSVSTYTLLDYDATLISQKIAAHKQANWDAANASKSTLSIVPSPQKFISANGSYVLPNNVIIHNALNNDNSVASLFAAYLSSDLGISATVDKESSTTANIVINKIDPNEINNNLEGYKIVVSPQAINVYATNNTGAFYALQTLRQLWMNHADITAGTITDYPKFKYRGILLDTARHFFSVAEIKNLIDISASHKLNTLHVHFSDDEGFRIGLKEYYNAIAAIADTRGYGNLIMSTMFIQANLDVTAERNAVYPFANSVYSGTYSESDLSSLVKYANARSITIIPEIDLPGHARALIKAFPDDLVDPNDQSKFISVQGYNDDVLPVCTYNTNISVGANFTTLIDNIIAKTAALFENQTTLYAANELSVGGDEVSSDAWSNDKSCIEDWSTLSALEKSHRFFGMLAAKHSDLKISGWQQFIQNNDKTLGKNIVPAVRSGHVWVWNTTTEGIAQAANLASNDYQTVLAFADKTYFDLAYTPDISEPGFTWATAFSDTKSALSIALDANTVLAKLSADKKSNIAGVEGALWSENLANYRHLLYMALPKMSGLAEAGWSGGGNWNDLALRLGCGKSGFLAYLNKTHDAFYRGYPNGIHLEIPENSCL